jgi:hypothetical protein
MSVSASIQPVVGAEGIGKDSGFREHIVVHPSKLDTRGRV